MGRPNKKHHKVPRTYLTAFANEDSKVWVADEQQRLYPETPLGILTENDFYTVRFPDGGGTLKIETEYLNGIEATYAGIYKEKLSQRKPLTKQERAAMAIFIASMLERSPRRREALQDGFNQVRDIAEKMQAMVADMTPEQKKAFAAAQPPVSEESRKNSIPASAFIEAGKDVGSFHSANIPASVATTAPVIFKMRWRFMVRPEGSEPFITSDSPCTLDNPNMPVRSIYGPGLAQKHIEVVMALSPDLAVLCGWLLKTDGEYQIVQADTVQETNRRVMRRSDTLVSNDKAMLEKQIKRVKNFLDKKGRETQ